MPLPTYDKTQRRKSYEALPKGAYVLRIMGAREEKNKSGSGTHLTIAFDIAEGEYKDFYKAQFETNSSEDKKWSPDATFYVSVPDNDSKPYIWTNWNTFFADLEDSNNGYVFAGDPKTMKGKLIGGKFRIEQTSYNGKVYNHTRLGWTCVADDVRSGKAEKSMPADRVLDNVPKAPKSPGTDFMEIPEGDADELPF